MWLEAIVPKDDLTHLAAEILPLTVHLGNDGELFLHDPTEVALVADVGLRLVCAVRLRWSVLGISVPITVRSVSVLLRPEVVAAGDGDKIAFKLEIDHLDMAGLPAGIDAGIVHLVNRELEAKHLDLSWGYAATLSHVFDLPDMLRPSEKLELAVDGARVRATEDALGLAIQFKARVHRQDGSALPAAAAAPLPSPMANGVRQPVEPAPAVHSAGAGERLPRGGTPPTTGLGVGWIEGAAFASVSAAMLVAGYAIGKRRARRFPWTELVNLARRR
jgi:hypothetical protein